MNRRNFILASIATALSACKKQPYLKNSCLNTKLPQHLITHPWYQQAWQGIDPTQVWDSHVHLLGTGDATQTWINPNMQSLMHPLLYAQYQFYLNAACIDDVKTKNLNHAFLQRLQQQLDEFPQGAKAMLLAFDYSYDEKGHKIPAQTPYYISNDYAASVVKQIPHRFEWIASIHPYRKDAVDALEKAVAKGAKAVKWLPPAMGIDPASARCKPFYRTLAKLNCPLLTHAGEEKAVFGRHLADAGNPLRLRFALEQGTTLIVAHCGALGKSHDLDNKNKDQNSFQLFKRLMDNKQYDQQLYADISAMPQVNRVGNALKTVIQRQDWHSRLLNGSDYPLPGVIPLFSLSKLAKLQLLDENKIDFLDEVRNYNVLLFDFLLKRHISYQGKRLSAKIFMTRSLFSTSFE